MATVSVSGSFAKKSYIVVRIAVLVAMGGRRSRVE